MNEEINEMYQEEDDALTRDQLAERLSAIRTHVHYVYALWKNLPKENFYILRTFDIAAKKNVEDDDANKFTVDEFLDRLETLHPEDPFFVALKVEKNDSDDCDPEANLLSYSDYDEVGDLSIEQVRDDVNDFLEAYCEKRLRENRPFYLTADTIRNIGFTKEDVEVLTPILDRFNKEAKIRIRAEYDHLADLDFIRNNEAL